MGVDYYAYAVLGCEVTGKLYDEVSVRSCDCPPAPGRFCATCGASTALRIVKAARPYYDEKSGTIANLVVRFTTDNERAFVGVSTAAATDGDAAGLVVHGAENAHDAIKAVLEPLGLWDPTTFGLWAVMYCSY